MAEAEELTKGDLGSRTAYRRWQKALGRLKKKKDKATKEYKAAEEHLEEARREALRKVK